MGVEASFQAMPENCDLYITARQDREIAEDIVYFHNGPLYKYNYSYYNKIGLLLAIVE